MWRQRRAAVIAEFDAGDTDATLQAMAAEILRYRHLAHVQVGWPWASCRSCLTIQGSGRIRTSKRSLRACWRHVSQCSASSIASKNRCAAIARTDSRARKAAPRCTCLEVAGCNAVYHAERGCFPRRTSRTAGLFVVCLPQVRAEHLVLDVLWLNTKLDKCAADPVHERDRPAHVIHRVVGQADLR